MKKFGMIFLIFCFTLASMPRGFAYYMSVRDAAGRVTVLKKIPERIISLAPANTEILYALGLGPKVAGVTLYCNYPEAAASVAKVGDFNRINLEKIISLRPDIIFATGGVQMPVIGKLENYGLDVVVLDAKTIHGVCEQIELAGRICGAEARAAKLTENIKRIVADVKRRTASQKRKPRVFFEVFDNPLYTAGRDSFINDLIEKSGGINIAGDIPYDYPIYSLEALIAAQPDIYLTYSHNTAKGLGDMLQRPGYSQLKCLQQRKLFFLDSDLISRTGPRVGEALLTISKILYPELWKKGKP